MCLAVNMKTNFWGCKSQSSEMTSDKNIECIQLKDQLAKEDSKLNFSYPWSILFSFRIFASLFRCLRLWVISSVWLGSSMRIWASAYVKDIWKEMQRFRNGWISIFSSWWGWYYIQSTVWRAIRCLSLRFYERRFLPTYIHVMYRLHIPWASYIKYLRQ